MLTPYEDYSREAVHGIFAPETTFTPQAGTWGLQGIVAIPERPDDWAFFVTFGQQQGDHVFDEGITQDGVLTWQSQPKQGFEDARIKSFILHDELRNSIHLFLRTKAGNPYTYLGRLMYLQHDGERERPVHFKWQILDWDLPPDVQSRMELQFQSANDDDPAPTGLVQAPPPARTRRAGSTTKSFHSRKGGDPAGRDAKNRRLGLAGEESVVELEKKLLVEAGRSDLAEKVRHVSKEEGDGAGYDIRSYTVSGDEKFIEVKTTKGGASSSFFITSNEVAFSEHKADNFYLCRVYDFQDGHGRYYVVAGSVAEGFELAASQYRASPATVPES